MASCLAMSQNLFGSRRSLASSGAVSEVSSTNSEWSDVQAIACQLGIMNLDDLYTERFKVDRAKLGTMITNEYRLEGTNNAEEFFNMVMKETCTHISWPCRLKLSAKTKKDPHVRIVGKKQNVLRAKDKIMSRLVSRGNRVIMKIDISYTDHSFIIGRGGNNIKRIMESTQTHIHFPDSNRANTTDKSNQVSICGTMQGTEKARSLVRLHTPLLYSFEMPVVLPDKPIHDNNTPFVQNIEKNYPVQVIFSSRQKLHSSLVLVKGSEQDVEKVKEATRRLMGFIWGPLAAQTNVQMQVDISVQHHSIVLGRGSTNLSEIMKSTGTKIIFPDATDVNIKPLKKSQVTLIGNIDGVYLARQQLIGSLPVALIFDYTESSLDPEVVNKIMYTYNVFVAVRQKTRQSTLCVVIKGIEKFISNIYEARHRILSLSGLPIIADIPHTWFFPNESSTQPPKNNSIVSMLQLDSVSPFSPFSPNSFSIWNNSPNGSLAAPTQGPTRGPVRPPPGIDVERLSDRFLHLSNQSSSSMPDISETKRLLNTSSSSMSPRNDTHSSGYQSINYSQSSLETNQHLNSSDGHSEDNFGIHLPPRKLSVDEKSLSRGLKQNSYFFNFDSRIIDGINAMHATPSREEFRTAKPGWQGLGLSRTSPAPIGDLSSLDKPMNVAKFNMSTQLLPDCNSAIRREKAVQYNDVASILIFLNLEHYIELFIKAEIDMSTFATLTDDDLLNLGIRTLGARRRILTTVYDLQQRSNRGSPLLFSGSAAPGAERRGSTGHI